MPSEECYNLIECEQKSSFTQAKDYLTKNRPVLITGVQGAGKTYLAKSLVNDLEKTVKKKKIVWIDSLGQLRAEKENITKGVRTYVFDGIFYELQSEEIFVETFQALTDILKHLVETKVLITVPSFIFMQHKRAFSEANLDDAHIDLDNMNRSEKSDIIQNLKTRYSVSTIKESQMQKSEGLVFGIHAFKTVGFPALMSWIFRSSDDKSFDDMMTKPLLKMSEELQRLKTKEKTKYLILSYVALHSGVLDMNNIDEELFDTLRKRYCPEFDRRDLKTHVKTMVSDNYLVNNKAGTFKFDLHVLEKIVFVSVAEDDPQLVRKHNKSGFERHVIKQETSDIKQKYPNCYLIV